MIHIRYQLFPTSPHTFAMNASCNITNPTMDLESCLLVQMSNMTCEEPQRCEELTEFNQPSPFLRLPRELRDEIYRYSLCQEPLIEITRWTLVDRDPSFKCPSPGLLRTSRQIYHESIEILYSKNTFAFEKPSHFFVFAEEIGPENRERVKKICIRIFWGWKDDATLYRWMAALTACRFEKIAHLGIEMWVNSFSIDRVEMPKVLSEFIQKFLGRVAENDVPRLTLKGFQEDERLKFPNWWKVEMKSLYDCREQIRVKWVDRHFQFLIRNKRDSWYMYDEDQEVVMEERVDDLDDEPWRTMSI